MTKIINLKIINFTILILILSLIPISFAGGGGKGTSNTFIEDKVYVADSDSDGNTNNIVVNFISNILNKQSEISGKIVDRDSLPSEIYDPFGNIIYKNNDFYSKEILNLTNVPNYYSNPDSILSDYNLNIIKQFNYATGNLRSRLKYNCQVGGQYIISGYFDTGDKYTESCGKGCTLEYRIVKAVPVNLFYCKTTNDLFQEVKIPKNWENDDIIIYCNDGLNKDFKEFNIDFITSKIDTYNSCIIKNLNLTNNNTIVYSFEKGNQNIDNQITSTPLIQQIFGENYEILSSTTDNQSKTFETISDTKTNKIYESSKYNDTSLFTLSNVNDMSNLIPISDIINSSDFELTRPILAKSFGDSKKLIGYENILRKEFLDLNDINENNSAMYKIKFLGFGNIQNLCLDSLGKYRATTSLAESSTIVCSLNTIKINDFQMSMKYNKYDGFNLFKNIILDTND